MLLILRLQNGEDIIGDVYSDEVTGAFTVYEPMLIGMQPYGQTQAVVLDYWLPVQLIKENVAYINPSDIMVSMEPNEEMEEYYNTTVSKLRKIKESREMARQLSDDDVTEMFEAMEDSKGVLLH